MAVIGTEEVRRGWRVRPRRVSVRCGAPLLFPTVEHHSPAQALGVTERIWTCVNLQWEWLGGVTRSAPAARAGAPASRARG